MSKIRKTSRKKARASESSTKKVVMIIAVIMTLLSVIWYTNRQNRYTEEQQHKFYEGNLRFVLENCVNGKTPYPEINERYQKLSTELMNKFGKRLNINMVTDYHILSKNIEMATGVQTNGTPEIAIYVPCVMNMFETVRQKHGTEWRIRFETHFLAIFMHEMEHAPYADIVTYHIDIKEESRAWLETCRNTLRPLTRKYGLTLIATEANMMRAWVDSGENANPVIWNEYVNRLYSGLTGSKGNSLPTR